MLTRLSLVIGLGVALGLPLAANAQQAPDTPKKDGKSDSVRDKRRDMRKKRDGVRDKRRDNRRDNRKKRDDVREKRRDNRETREVREKRRDMREKRGDVREKRRDERKSTRDLRKKSETPAVRDQRRKRARRWRNRAVVTRYSQGPKRTVVRGENFPSSAIVTVDGKRVKATVTPTRISFDASVRGVIAIKIGDGSIVVGRNDASTKLTKAERKAKRKANRDARRKRARAVVKTRWKKRPGDRAKRRERLKERRARARATRAKRAKKRASEVRGRVAAKILARVEVRAELALHAERMARLLRMRELSTLDDNDDKAVRVEVLIERESERHKTRMSVFASAEVTP